MRRWFQRGPLSSGNSDQPSILPPGIAGLLTLQKKPDNEAFSYLHEGLHVFANSRYAELFGYEDNKIFTGIEFLALVEYYDRSRLKNYLRGCVKRCCSLKPIEVCAIDKDGVPFLALINCTPLRVGTEPYLKISICRK